MIIREYKKEDLYSVAKVHVDVWNSTYSNIILEEYLRNRTYENQVKRWSDRLFDNPDTKEFMFVVENRDNEVIGFSSATIDDKDCKYDSILYTLYILEEYQKQGLGKMLVKAVASKLKVLGARSMILWAFAENDACSFYEHLGGKRSEERTVNIGGNDLLEIAFVWDDITVLDGM